MTNCTRFRGNFVYRIINNAWIFIRYLMIWGTWILSVLLIHSILSQVFRRILCNCNDTIRIYHLFASIMKSSASFLIPLLPILFAHTLSFHNICWFFFHWPPENMQLEKHQFSLNSFIHSFISDTNQGWFDLFNTTDNLIH